MAQFDVGETVICSVEIRDDAGALKDPNGDTASPSTHTKITITDKFNVAKVSDVGMTRDSVGEYHYDCQTTGYIDGNYGVKYVATDGTRITIEKETFELEE